jgi:hypothetical protein
LSIHYLTHNKINKGKWDSCIKLSANGLIYAEYDYLETIASKWDALVLNDYEAVMPLCWRRKLGIKYLYQPSFFQQGGVFSKQDLSEDLIAAFIREASMHFKFAEITLNYKNVLNAVENSFSFSLRNNYVLELKNGYRNIFAGFKPTVRQRIKKATQSGLQYHSSLDYIETITLYRKLYQQRLPEFSNKDYAQFQKLCAIYFKQNRILVRKVTDKEGKDLLGATLLLKDEKRLYNIISCILPNGKDLLANYFMYDRIINEFAGTEYILDFEGSDKPGIAHFYKKFTGTNEPYPFVKFNNLPAAIKLIKP